MINKSAKNRYFHSRALVFEFFGWEGGQCGFCVARGFNFVASESARPRLMAAGNERTGVQLSRLLGQPRGTSQII